MLVKWSHLQLFFPAFSCEMLGYKAKSEMQTCLFQLNHKIEKFNMITVSLGQMERFISHLGYYE